MTHFLVSLNMLYAVVPLSPRLSLPTRYLSTSSGSHHAAPNMNFARKRLLSLLNTSDVTDPGKVLQQVLLKLWRQPDRQNHGGWQQAGAAAARC